MQFITSTLPGSVDDWECALDFCGSWDGFGFRDRLNIAAWWSPTLSTVSFCGDWTGTPDMPSSSLPTEEACWQWVKGSGSIWARRYAAARRRTEMHKAAMESLEAHFRLHGYNWVTLSLRRPDSGVHLFSQCIGRRSRLEILPAISHYLRETLPPGYTLVKLSFESGLSEKEVVRRRTHHRQPSRIPARAA